MGAILDLIRTGECVLFHDYRQQHARDLSGNENHGVPSSTVTWNKFGACFYASTSRVVVPHASSLVLTDGTMLLFSQLLKRQGAIPAASGIMGKVSGGTREYQIYFTTDALLFMRAGATISSFSVGTAPISLAVTWEVGVEPDLYIDGVFEDQGSLAVTPLTGQTSDLYIGGVDSNGSQAKMTLGAALLFNTKLTANQIEAVQAELQADNPKLFSFRRNIEGSTQAGNAVAAWDGVVANEGLLKDNSTQEAHMTLTQASGRAYTMTPAGRAISGGYVTPTAAQKLTGRPMAFGCWFRPFGSDSQQLCGQGFASFRMYYGDTANTVDLRLDSNNKVVVFSDTSVHNVWSHYLAVLEADQTIRCYRDGEEDVSAQDSYSAFWAASSVNYRAGTATDNQKINGLILRHRVWDGAISADVVKQEYNQVARALVYRASPIDRRVQSDLTAGTVNLFEIISGTWNFADEYRRAYLKCVATGRLIFNTQPFEAASDAAHGTWEFDYYKGSVDGTRTRILFCASSTAAYNDAGQNGYMLEFRTDDGSFRIDLRKITAGVDSLIASTPDDVIVPNQWMHLRVTRNSLGKFCLFVNTVQQFTPTIDTDFQTTQFVNFQIATNDRLHQLTKRLGALLA